MAAGTITIRLDALDGTDDEIRQLAHWLRDEDELRGGVDLRNEPVQQGHMGGLTEAIVVSLSGGGFATVLVNSLFNWLDRRRDATKVTITVESAERKLELTAGSADDAERLIAACRDFLSESA